MTAMPNDLDRRGWLRAAVTIACAGAVASVPSAPTAAQARGDFDELYTPQVDRAIARGLEYLSQMYRGGAFRTPRWGENLGVCSLAALAMLSRGHRPGEGREGQIVTAIAQRLTDSAGPEGFINDPRSQSHGPMYEHAFATLLLAEIYGTAAASGPSQDELSATVAAAVDLMVRSQTDRGGWRYDPRPTEADLSVTVAVVMALRAARNSGFYVPDDCVDLAVEYIRRSQNPDGGFAYRLDGTPSRMPLTAAAAVALYNCGITGGTDLQRAFAYLDAFEPSRDPPFASYYFYAHYYSAQAYWHRGGETWPAWYAGLSRRLLTLQGSNGSWIDSSQGNEYATAMGCLILNTPRSVLPIYQR